MKIFKFIILRMFWSDKNLTEKAIKFFLWDVEELMLMIVTCTSTLLCVQYSDSYQQIKQTCILVILLVLLSK